MSLEKLKKWLLEQVEQQYAECQRLRREASNNSLMLADLADERVLAYTAVLEQMEKMNTKPKSKTKIVKIDRLQVCRIMEDNRLFLGSTEHTRRSILDQYYGKVALSFKKGKKRIIVKGTITSEIGDDSAEFGLFWHWYFVPKNANAQAKLKEQMNARNP